MKDLSVKYIVKEIFLGRNALRDASIVVTFSLMAGTIYTDLLVERNDPQILEDPKTIQFLPDEEVYHGQNNKFPSCDGPCG